MMVLQRADVVVADGQLRARIDLVGVVVARVVQVVADGGGDEDAEVLLGQQGVEAAQVDHPVHHLAYAEAVAKVVERVVPVVGLDA